MSVFNVPCASLAAERFVARSGATTRSVVKACHFGLFLPLRGDGIPGPVKIRGRRRTPDGGLARFPGLRPLRRVLMPRPRLEITELFIGHSVEFAEKFDHLIVRIAVIGSDVVTRPVAQRPPDDRDFLLPE